MLRLNTAISLLLFAFSLSPVVSAQSIYTGAAKTTSGGLSAVPEYGTGAPDLPPDTTRLPFSRTITAGDIEKHVRYLASDELQGRETGHEGQRKAAQYIENQFRENGLEPVAAESGYRQSFELLQPSWGEVYIESNGERFSFLRDFYGYPSTNNSIAFKDDAFVFLGYGIDDPLYSDYEGMDVRDKVVLILAGEPIREDGNYWLSGSLQRSAWSLEWQKKLEVATAHGVKVLLVVSTMAKSQMEQKSFANYIGKPRMVLSDHTEGSPYCNNLYLTTETAEKLFGKHAKVWSKYPERIKKKFEPRSREIPVPVEIQVQKSQSALRSDNVLAVIQGTDRADEYVFVTAHYDHLGFSEEGIFYGADDNASGTSAILEVAQALSLAQAAEKGPRRSVVFMTVSGEEKGLLGSEYFTEHPLIPLEQITTNLNVDMVGRVDEKHENDPFYVYTIGSDFLSTELHAMQEETVRDFGTVTVDYTYNNTKDPNRYYYRSDHYNFAKNKIPVIFYFNGNHDDYHQVTDTPDKIRYDLIEARARLVFNTLWTVANADRRPVVDSDPESR